MKEQLQLLLDKIEAGEELTAEEQQLLDSNEFIDELSGVEELREKVLDLSAREKMSLSEAQRQALEQQDQRNEARFKRDTAAGDVYNIASAGRDIFKTAQALNQIRRGEQEAQNLQTQEQPFRSLPKDQMLQQRLFDAQAREGSGLDPATRAALNASNISAYQGALRNARVASGGQAGLFSNLAQSAALDRQRANIEIAARDQAAREEARARTDALVGQNMAENRYIQNQYAQDYFGRYLPDLRSQQQEAKNLALTGRQNLSDIMEYAPYTLGNLTRNYAMFNQQRGIQPQMNNEQISQQPTSFVQDEQISMYTPEQMNNDNLGFKQKAAEASLLKRYRDKKYGF